MYNFCEGICENFLDDVSFESLKSFESERNII